MKQMTTANSRGDEIEPSDKERAPDQEYPHRHDRLFSVPGLDEDEETEEDEEDDEGGVDPWVGPLFAFSVKIRVS